jgi:hypothetical protein
MWAPLWKASTSPCEVEIPAESDRRVVNGILLVTILPGAGWARARGPRAILQVRTRARNALYRIVTDVRQFDPGLRFDRMDLRGPPWLFDANTCTWVANVLVGIRRAHRIACLSERSYVSRC